MNLSQVALVTGATGFIGLNLTACLLQAGWEVHVVVRPHSNIAELKQIASDKLKVHVYGEKTGLPDIIATARPDVVFHLASLFLAHHQYEDIPSLIESNILFGTQLVDAMIRNKVYCLINTGTSWQHYNNEIYNPVCLYAAAKQAFESMLIYYQKIAPLKVITLKLFDTYGPGDKRKKLFMLLYNAAHTNASLAMSAGEQLIDLVYIDDVIRAFILSAQYLLAKDNEFSRDYAITSGRLIKLKDLVSVYEEILGKRLNIEWGKRPYRDREVMIPWQTGRKLPGWSAKVILREGISKVLQYERMADSNKLARRIL